VAPLIFDDGKPFIDAQVRIGEEEAKTFRLTVDLGASHVVSLNESKRTASSPQRRRLPLPSGAA
jgi:hypothetical protein